MLGFMLAFIANLSCAMKVVAFFLGVGLIIAGVVELVSMIENEPTAGKVAKKLRVTFSWLFPVAMILTALPSTKDLWSVRIDLIKLELASPANIEKSAEEIGRLSKKLECKYLGCPEEQPKKDSK